MTRKTPTEDFMPHYEPAAARDIEAALADLGVTERWGGLTVPLPYTERRDGTVDTIEVDPHGQDWTVHLGRERGGIMPIRPSIENGSSMFIEAPDLPDPLAVEYAELVARPENYNRLVGTQKNHPNASVERDYERLEVDG